MSESRTPTRSTTAIDINQITIPPSPFLNRLGYGTGVSVMQLVRSPRAGQIRSPWALKMLNKKVKHKKVYTERLRAEADLLQRMSHPNIVGFRAFSKGKILYLGMEACDLSLGDMIEKKVEDSSEPFEPIQILKVALDVGKALEYLHTDMLILHGDIKSYNILVNGDFMVCKVCDFGVTLPLNKDGQVDKEKAGNAVYFGTEAWSAPEVIKGETITSATDIWPLGLTLWEMLALTAPHSEMDDDTLQDMSMDSLEESNVMDLFSERYGTRPAVPDSISAVHYAGPLALFWCCTEQQPGGRPTGQHVAAAAAHFLAN